MGSLNETGVKRYQTTGISVLIVGAGVAGLMAALECWRKGHDVQIIERSPERVTAGDSFSIGSTAISSFRNWPDMMEENERIAYNPYVSFHLINGELVNGPIDIFESTGSDGPGTSNGDQQTNENGQGFPTRMYRHARPKFHAMLNAQAKRVGVQVQYGKRVVKYIDEGDGSAARVLLEDGETLEADVIVAADGIGSKSTGITMGHEVKARSTGYILYRTAFPVEVVLSDPEVCDQFPLAHDGRPLFQIWSGEGCHAIFGRDNEQFSWFMNRTDDGTAKESWSTRADPEEALKYTATIPGWPEIANRVIKLTPKDQLMDFKLMWRDPQPITVSPSGRIVQVGDAAHTYLPASGNGATQGIEDAVSLAACLQLGGKANASWATKVHNRLRFERVSCFQISGILNQQSYESENIKQKSTALPKPIKRLTGGWVWKHDPEQYAVDRFAEAMDSVKNGTPFRNTNIPPGYVYKPWTLDEMLEKKARGEEVELEGNWE